MLESHAGKEYSRAGSLSREQEAIQFASSEPAIRSTSAQSPWPLALVPSFTLDRCGSDSHVRSTAKRGSRQFHSALGRSAAIQESSSTMPTVPPFIIDCDGWSAVAASTQSLTNNPTGIVIHHMANANSNDFSFAHAVGIARNCQIDHMNRGWGDSGQHFTVTRGGYVFEGRRGSFAALQAGSGMMQGAHTVGRKNDGLRIEKEGLY